MTIQAQKFTIRVYGIWIHEGRVLVAEEMHKGQRMHKFPGGGLTPGESTRDCLTREFHEETGIFITVGEHFYTTDFFVASAFDPTVQVVSIYYRVQAEAIYVPANRLLDENKSEDEIFRWLDPSEIAANDYFSFPIDQHVGQLLWRELLH